MLESFDILLIVLSVLLASITLYFSCSFITRIYLATSAQKVTLLPTYAVMIGGLLFCLDNLMWVAMRPVMTGSQFSIAMILGSLFAAMFATFNVFSTASKKNLSLSTLINRGFIVSLASYVMFYLTFASRHPANAITVDLTSLSIALIAGTCICAAVIMYYYKMKHNAEGRPALLKAALSLGTGLIIVILYAIFNASLNLQQQVLTEGNHVVSHRETFATIMSLAILSLLTLTIGAPKYIEQLKARLSAYSLLNSHHSDDLHAKDALTLLPNRHGFELQLDAAIKRSARAGKTFALAYIDLDHFKPINDSYGHHVGDAVLVAVAQRLNATVRACDYVARLGGDEFVAIIEEIRIDEDITPVIGRMVSTINEPFYVNQHHINISCSIGVAVYQGDSDVNKLIICADAAMYKAKENGKNQFKFFDAEIELASDQMLTMHGDLRQAIDNEEFVLLFQPKLDCKTQLPVGAEALIRWNHPTKGLLMPDAFLSAAEHFGLINSINEWVVQQSCRTIYQAKKIGINLNVSINLASQQFRNANLVVEILEAIHRNDISVTNLMFEIKETTAINNEAQFMSILNDFKAAKIKVALDDFGSHNFNLSYLQNLHVDEVKLDRIFIAQMNGTKASHAIVDAVIRLAHALDLNVVAEGVETEEQRKALTELGCNQMQGYFFSKAISEKKLFALFNQSVVNQNHCTNAKSTFSSADYQQSTVISNVLKH